VSGLDPERRRRLLETVAGWVDELAEAEPAPPGLAPELVAPTEPAPDLFSLLGQLTALTRETQLQGRATNRLHAKLEGPLEKLAHTAPSPESIARQLGEVRSQAQLELLAELLDVRDRLARNLAEAQRRLAAPRGFRWRLGRRPVLQALVEGNALALERLDDLLSRRGVREIPGLGRPFDPTTMQAVEAVRCSAAPGTVVEVFRAGYTGNGLVLRFAEVKVAAGTPAAKENGADG